MNIISIENLNIFICERIAPRVTPAETKLTVYRRCLVIHRHEAWFHFARTLCSPLSFSFPDISFRDEGFPDFILRRSLGGHVFETSFLPSLRSRRVSYSCSSCAQARNHSLRLSFIGRSLVSDHQNGLSHCCCFVSLLLRLFAFWVCFFWNRPEMSGF